jgi:hypothetical protein
MVQEIVPVDNVAPVSTAQAVPAPNAAGWNRSAVTVTLTATDDASGVARIEYNLDNAGYVAYTSPVVISTDLVHTLLYRAIDRVSNLETARSLTIKLDKTAPTVTYTGNTGTYNILATVNIACSAADNLSGVASSTCQDISGAAYTFAVGANAFSATATDVAGNTGSGSTSFTLVVTFADLRTLTAQFSSNPGVANGLSAKLDAAEASAARGNRTAQDNQIAAYQNDVRAQTGKALTSTQAATLIRLSNALL